jgi:hypothetical protein
MAGMSVEQAWAIAADPGALRDAADHLGRVSGEIGKFVDLLDTTVKRVTDRMGELSTLCGSAGANVDSARVKADWLATVLDGIGAAEASEQVSGFAARCEDHHAAMSRAWQAADKSVAAGRAELQAQVDRAIEAGDMVSGVRRRVLDAL